MKDVYLLSKVAFITGVCTYILFDSKQDLEDAIEYYNADMYYDEDKVDEVKKKIDKADECFSAQDLIEYATENNIHIAAEAIVVTQVPQEDD